MTTILASVLLVGSGPLAFAAQVDPVPTPTPAVNAAVDPSPPTPTPILVPGTPAPGPAAPPIASPVPAGQSCYAVLDKTLPGQSTSKVVESGCQPTRSGQRPQPRIAASAPSPAAAAAAAVPIAELYENVNYGGRSFIVYGSQGPCDAAGYSVSDSTNANTQVGGISSFKTYNGCDSQMVFNDTQFKGQQGGLFAGTQTPNVGTAFDNRVLSLKLRAGCTYYSQTRSSVCGAIRKKYEDLGGPGGALGYPTSNELTNPDGTGKRNTFQNRTASIYWSPASGAHEIEGLIYQKWGQQNYERGPLGYPYTSEYATLGGRRNDFAGGNIVFNAANGTTTDTRGVNPLARCLSVATAAATPFWFCNGRGVTASWTGSDGKRYSTLTPVDDGSTPAPQSRQSSAVPGATSSEQPTNSAPPTTPSPSTSRPSNLRRQETAPTLSQQVDPGFSCTKAICPIARTDVRGDTLANASYGTMNEGLGFLQLQYVTTLNGRSPVYRLQLRVIAGNPVDPVATFQTRKNVDDFFDDFQGPDYNISPVGYQTVYDSATSNQNVNAQPVTGDGEFYAQIGFRMEVQGVTNDSSPNGDGSFQADTIETPRWDCAGSSTAPGQACKFRMPTLYRGYDPDGMLR